MRRRPLSHKEATARTDWANAAGLAYRQAHAAQPQRSTRLGSKVLEKVTDTTAVGCGSATAWRSIWTKPSGSPVWLRTSSPIHVRVAFLQAQIGKERERAVLAQARQAAASGHIEQALAALDGANHDTRQSPLVNETRQELEQKQLDTRIRDFLSRANDRMRDGQLVEPPQDNAGFYIESARGVGAQ